MSDHSPSRAAERLVSGFRIYQLLVAACRLKLPDLIAAGPKTADELAASTGTHAPSLRRMLRGLAAWEVLVELPDGRFASTPLSDRFRSDQPGQRNITLMLSEGGYEAWADLMYTLRTGKPAFEHVFGKSHFERLAENPEAGEQFNVAMLEMSTPVASAFVATYDFAGVHTVVDVGGGNGALLRAALQKHPEVQGVLFDLAQGLAGAKEILLGAGVGDRVMLHEGNFFEAVPSGGDLYLLKWIIHDWDDERALVILRNCKDAMSPSARLVLLERKVPARIEHGDESLGVVMGDLHMMVVLGGRERTTDEYRNLLAGAGLRMTREVAVGTDFAAVEAVVV